MLIAFFQSVYSSRTLLLTLVKNDFKSRYFSNVLGVVWAFIHPVLTIAVLWTVFEVGFKVPVSSGDVPFILWLISGMIPWFYFGEALSSGCGSIKESSFLVKKIVFRVSLLPLIKQISALVVHVFFVFAMLMLFMAYGYYPNLYWLQLIYYVLCASLLLLGTNLFLSSVTVFFTDLSQIVAMLIQIGFWLTPIFWEISMVPEGYRAFFAYNPAFYIVDGFRDSLINHIGFWEKPDMTFAFFGFTLLALLLGISTFRRLRPHFADVL